MTSLEAGIKIYWPKRLQGLEPRRARGGLGGSNLEIEVLPQVNISECQSPPRRTRTRTAGGD